jgi:hypothetical protein
VNVILTFGLRMKSFGWGFGKWSRFASCGAYGPRGMGDSSRIPKEAWGIFYISFLLPFSLGMQLGWPIL